MWERTFGGAGDDFSGSVVELADGGLVVAGSTDSKGAGGHDAWVLRLDGAGRILWERTFGGTGDDFSRSIVELADGGFVVAGSTDSKGAGDRDVWLLRLDGAGSLLWDRTFDSTGNDGAGPVVAVGDGGFAFASSTEAAGERDIWVVRLAGGNNPSELGAYIRQGAADVRRAGAAEQALGQLTVIVTTPLTRMFDLRTETLVVQLDGPVSRRMEFENVATAFPVQVNFGAVPEGAYSISILYGTSSLKRSLNVSGRTTITDLVMQ